MKVATDKTNEVSKTETNEANEDEAKALELSKAAEAGSGRAMNLLGLCYDRGQGVPKDMAKAVEWYTKAAEKGDTNGMHNLGGFYDEKGEKDKAVEWYAKAAQTTGHEASEAGKRNATEAGIEEPSDAKEGGAPVTPEKQMIPPPAKRRCPGAPARAH